MYTVVIPYHEEFYKYLQERRVIKKEQTFSFLHLEHFTDVTSSFISEHIVSLEINKLISNDVISPDEIDNLRSCIDADFLGETKYFISNSLMGILEEQNQFSLPHFISFFLSDIQREIQALLYNSLPYLSEKHTEIKLGEEKADVLYMVVESNGSITIEKKDCTVISNCPYQEQEHSIAEALYINPTLLIVYDAFHLLKPELTRCLKNLLRKKVVFLGEEHPLRKNQKT
ncbi:hypothetical protein WKH56_10375 [Priestia sp. SB1]|uniref:hypothetical protein n=1 Tax=Priestia sp. SB1 TaxID=3132359 RepID=UPI003178690D